MTSQPEYSYEQLAGAPAWRPENADEKVSGEVVGFDLYTHPEFGTSPVVIIDDKNLGLVRVYAIHGVMLDTLSELKPQKGERLTILYQGRKDSRQRKDSQGKPVSYSSYLVYKGDGDTSKFDVSPF